MTKEEISLLTFKEIYNLYGMLRYEIWRRYWYIFLIFLILTVGMGCFLQWLGNKKLKQSII